MQTTYRKDPQSEYKVSTPPPHPFLLPPPLPQSEYKVGKYRVFFINIFFINLYILKLSYTGDNFNFAYVEQKSRGLGLGLGHTCLQKTHERHTRVCKRHIVFTIRGSGIKGNRCSCYIGVIDLLRRNEDVIEIIVNN